ncbi:MAG: ABC transporter ATP-binding protein [Bacteroidota bacterium]
MSKPIIEIKSVSKSFRINKETGSYLSIRDSITSFFSSRKSKTEDFFALRDISFNVKKGESIGIIGKNGAGKSTLLKVLSKITPPTSGSVICRGRVASLLEVGTGFHPELTGRENIFFNGSILGMKRSEIMNNLDNIIQFSGVEKFIDTPLKHYSSGMQVRLAFSVAAFLQNEILIIDEILAVGDYEFQKKCLGKMNEVSKSGRTVIFVSHDLNALSVFTKKCVLLDKGMVQSIDSTPNVIAEYFLQHRKNLEYLNNRIANEFPVINSAKLKTSHPDNVHAVKEKFTVEVTISMPSNQLSSTTWLSIHITDVRGKGVVHLWVNSNDIPVNKHVGEKIIISCTIPSFKLYMGKYLVNFYLSGPPGGEVYDKVQNVCPFEIVMLNMHRDFAFEPDVCSYLEDAKWETQSLT